MRVDGWCAALPKKAWLTVDVRDAARGPLAVQCVKTRVGRKPTVVATVPKKRLWFCGKRRTTERSSTITTCRTPRPRRRWRSLPAWRRRSIGLRSVWSGPKARPALPSIRFATGSVGIIIKRFPCWRRGSSRKKTSGGKNYTPALTVPRVRTIIASLLHRALHCGSPAYIERHNTRVMQRNESAYAYHWKSRNRLAPQRFKQRK